MNRLISLGKTSPFFIQLAFIIGKQLIQIMLTKTRGTFGNLIASQELQGIFTIIKKIKSNRSQPRKKICHPGTCKTFKKKNGVAVENFIVVILFRSYQNVILREYVLRSGSHCLTAPPPPPVRIGAGLAPSTHRAERLRWRV
jgi:hypothetical protein